MQRSREQGLKVRNKKAGSKTGFFLREGPEQLEPSTEGVD